MTEAVGVVIPAHNEEDMRPSCLAALGDLGASSSFGELATQGRVESAVLTMLRRARAS